MNRVSFTLDFRIHFNWIILLVRKRVGCARVENRIGRIKIFLLKFLAAFYAYSKHLVPSERWAEEPGLF